VGELDGVWDVRRTGGLLPPMTGVSKRIVGTHGTTRVGSAVGSIGDRFFRRQTRRRHVVTLGPLLGVDVRRRGNAARIDRLHLLGVREDVGKLPGEEMLLFIGQLQLRERGDAFDVGDGERRGHQGDRNSECKIQNANSE